VKKRDAILATALLAIVGLAVLVTGCGSSSSDNGGTAKVFKIGYSADISDGYASCDVPYRDGLQYAIDEINKAGGVAGMKLELIVKDNKNDAALAAQTTQQLIGEGIQYLAGTTSDQVVACNRLAEEKQIPSDCGVGTAPTKQTDVGEYCFQYDIMDNQQGAAMANYCYTELGYRTAYLLESPDSAYTANLPIYFKETYEKLGGKIVGTSDYKLGASDFSAQVTKIQNNDPKPDMIYTPMFMPDTPVFLKQLRAAGVDIPVASGDGCDTVDLLAAGAQALDGLIFTTHTYPVPGSATYDFNEAFTKATGHAPEGAYTALGYDAGQILKAALEKTGGKGGKALRDALANVSGVQILTTDSFTMDPATRNGNAQAVLVKMDGAKFTFVKQLPLPEYVPPPL
jgi:branched-chain amino acid transport system substrate-binding protein